MGYALNNHTSVVGMREYALNKDAEVFTFNLLEGFSSNPSGCSVNLTSADYVQAKIESFKNLSHNHSDAKHATISTGAPHLLVVAAESNFDGTRINLNCLSKVGRQQDEGCSLRYYICLDAAKYCGAHLLNLDSIECESVDFVAVCLTDKKLSNNMRESSQ